MAGPIRRKIPLWLKLALGTWLAFWIPTYAHAYPPANFLWFCDLANVLIAVALWLESPLLLASQAIGVLVVQVLWCVDVLGRLLTGVHPIGGTEYMFDPAKPLALRLVSLFHVVTPPLLVWSLWRLGYDRRGWRLQAAITALVLPLSYLAGPELNLNWTWGPFGEAQQALPPLVYLALSYPGYVLLLYLPSHLLLRRLFPPPLGTSSVSSRGSDAESTVPQPSK